MTPSRIHLSLIASLRAAGDQLASGAWAIPRYRQHLCHSFLEHFACSRASLWRFIGPAGARQMRCVGRSIAGQGFSQPGEVIEVWVLERYLAHLTRHGYFDCADVRDEPLLAELRPYLAHNGVIALMDAAFHLNGEAFGLVCLEQVGAPRAWSAAELASLREAVVQISLAIGRASSRLKLQFTDAPDFDEDSPGF